MSSLFSRYALLLALGGLAVTAACYDGPKGGSGSPGPSPAETVALTDLPGHAGLAVDTRPKQGPRTMPVETYLRSYQMLFGGISAQEIAQVAKGADGNDLFGAWSDSLGALGLPDYALDIARASDTNTVMLGAYERLGIALCDRAVERELRAGSTGTRLVFDFRVATDPLDRAAFDDGFERLHRTFLGYPSKLSQGRNDRFFGVYSDVVRRHAATSAPVSKFSPGEAGWAVVCYGLIRHPEFHLY